MSIYLLLFSGLIFRLISLDQSLWLDEAVQAWASRELGLKELLFHYLGGDFNPPLFHSLLHFWIKIFGDSEISVRMPSVLLGVGSVWLVDKLFTAKESIQPPPRWSGLAALLLAISPLHIYYSQEARMYSLSCFAVLLVVWRFLLWQKESDFKNGLFLAISLVLMGFSHYLTLLILPIFWIVTKRRSWLPLALIHLPLVGLYFLYSPIFFQQIKTGMAIKGAFPVWGKTVGRASLKETALLPVKFIIGRISLENKFLYGVIAGVLVMIYWGLAILGFDLLFSLLLFLPPIIGFLISFFVPVFSYFRFLFCLPFFYLLIGKGIDKMKKKKILIVFLLGTNIICSFVYLLNSSFHREDWRGMVGWLHSQEKASVLILSQVSKPFEYYDRGKSNLLFWPNDQEKIAKNDKIWLIEYALPIFDSQGVMKERLLTYGYILGEQKAFREIILSFWLKEIYAYRH